jgi:hypothetical protein
MRRYHLALPLLFAAHPALYLYAHNVGRVRFPQVLPSLLGALLFALLVLLVSWRLVRDRPRAVIVASIFLLVFFAYGHAADVLFRHRMGDPPSPFDFLLCPSIGVLVICLGTVVAEHRGDARPILNLLGVGALSLLVASLLQVIPRELGRKHPVLPSVSASELQVDPNAPACKGPPPDIYYLILDRYPGSEATRAVLDLDNREFLDWLRSQGFYVAEKSRTNYPRTCLSLASSLNLVYLTDLARQMGKTSGDETPTYEMLRNSTVLRFLKARGYRYVHTGSWWEPTRTNPQADVDLGAPFVRLSQFSRLFLDTTLVRPFLAYLRLVPDRISKHRDTTLYQLKKLEGVPAIKGPKFVFAHLLLPHPPWVFGPTGEPLDQGQMVGGVGRCLDQIEYTNKQVRALIANILTHSERPPIILLQADEGMEHLSRGAPKRPNRSAKLRAASLHHLSILNAYYLPGVAHPDLYPTISPVNSFRLVFNRYFGTHLARLPDESWLIEKIERPYDQIAVEESAQPLAPGKE